MSSSELVRLRKYTDRVTNLQVYEGLNVETFKTLIGSHQSRDWIAMWPRLKILWWIAPESLLGFLRHFLTLGLRNLKINFEGAEDEVFQEVLCLVESRCMNLEELRLFDSETRENKEIQDTIRQIIYNNSLSLKLFWPPHGPSSPLVNDVLQLRSLEDLQMQVPAVPDHALANILPDLQSLSLTLDEPLDVIDLFHKFKATKLKEFSLVGPYPTSPDDQNALSKFFGEAELHQNLKALSWVPYPGEPGPSWGFITTLYRFNNLNALALGDGCGRVCRFRFPHVQVVQISMWLPRLTALTLGGSPCASGGLSTDIGYDTLVTLARNCPNLYLLVIHFNAKTCKPIFSPIFSVIPNLKVGLWDVGQTTLPDHPWDLTMVALAIAMLFPNVKFIRTTGKWEVIREEHFMFTLPPDHKLLDLG